MIVSSLDYGKLWYAITAKVLHHEGYPQTPMYQCIINLILYVYYILLFADLIEIKRVKTFMIKEFQLITVPQENIQSYLGMNVELQ